MIAKLCGQGVQASVLHLPCNPVDESAQYGPERFARDHCPVQRLELLRASIGTGPWMRPLQLTAFVVDRRRLRRFLTAERPDVVVVGSDLGNAHIRLLLDLCNELRIRTMILATVASGPLPHSGPEKGGAGGRGPVARMLRALNLERVLTFNHWTTGRYDTSALIAVATPALREQLVQQGIAADRIVVTGSPRHDQLYHIRQAPVVQSKPEIFSRLRLPSESRLITYCTERIQDVYGRGYLTRLNTALALAFDALPEECRVMVKLHPRETAADEEGFASTFSGERYRLVRDLELFPLLRASDLVVGHFSAVLTDSMLLGTPTLSIQIANDPERALFDSRESVLTIGSEPDLALRIHGMLYDSDRQQAAAAATAAWVARCVGELDGRSTERVAATIMNIMGTEGAQSLCTRPH